MSRRISLHPRATVSRLPQLIVEPKWVEVAKEVLGEQVFDPEAGRPGDDPFQIESDGYDDMTVPQLKEILQEEGVSTKGKKADLIARLRMPISDSTEAPADEAAVEEEEVGPVETAPADENPEEGTVSESEESSEQEPTVE